MSLVPPPLVMILLLVVLSASLFHALFGRTARGWLVLLVAALGGFVAGEALARLLDQEWGRLGPVHLAAGLAGAWAVMALVHRRVA
jgi:hypothetical protein